jgi:hypothetical protein
MEGYRQFPEQDHEAALGRLRGRLNDRNRDRRRGFVLWRVAAAIVFIIIAGGIFWMANDRLSPEGQDMAFEPAPVVTDEKATSDLDNDQLALNEDKKQQPVPEASPKEKVIPDVTIDRPAAEKPASPEMDDPGQLAGLKKESNAPSPPAIVNIDAPVEPGIAVAEEIAVKDEAAPTQMPAEDSAAFSWADLEDDFNDSLNVVLPEERQYIIGTILAENNEPLIGVNVSALGTQLTTMSNIRGQFKLEWRPDIEKLELLYNGYEKTMTDVQGPGSLSVKMTQLANLELNEDAIPTAPAPTIAETRRTFIGQPKVMPVGGFEAFEKYIGKNKKLPADLSQGEVLLQFVVHPDGSISNINSLQSSDKRLEQEAIRLLTQGPLWHNPSDKDQVMEYVVKF